MLRRTRARRRAARRPPRRSRCTTSRSTSPRAARCSPGDELELSRKEFDLLAELVRNAGRVVTREDLMSRVWDENWFGSTKTLDVHMGWLRRKLGDDAADPALHPHGARRRLPLRRARRSGPVGLRARLLLALAYVLVLAVVALEVPLASSVADRIDAEVRSQARGQADLVAATVADLLGAGRPRASASALVDAGRRERARPRDRRRRPGRPARRLRGHAARPLLRRPARDRGGARRPPVDQRERHSETLGADAAARPRSPVARGPGDDRRGAHLAERRGGRPRGPPLGRSGSR